MRRIHPPTRRRRAVTCIAVAVIGSILLGSVGRSAFPARAAASHARLTAATDAAALSEASQTGDPVLATDDTTTTTEVFGQPDGTMTAQIAAGPVREPDPTSASGWTPIDSALSDTGPSITPAVTDAGMAFSDGGTGPLATLDVTGSDTYTEQWVGSLPAPTLSGDTATYVNVQSGVDLQLQARPTGFEQSWIINSAPTSPLTLDVPLQLKGLKATVASDGTLTLTDKNGNVKAGADPALMWGATTDPRTQEPTVETTVPTKVVQTASGPMLEITPDPSFFSDPGVTYPVTIDPTPSLSVVQDTYVRSDFATTSYSSDVQLKTGSANGVQKTRALLSFPTDDLAGQDILSASLSLYQQWSTACGASSTNQIWNLTSPFDSTTTWNTQPPIGSIWAQATSDWGYDSTCPGAFVTFTNGGTGGANMTQLVQGWANGSLANDGIEIKGANETDANSFKKFQSADGTVPAHVPTLTVNYNTIPADPGLFPSGGAAQSTLTPTLSASFDDADGGNGNATFSVYKRLSGGGNGALVISGLTGTTVATGNDSTATVPSGLLVDGHSYNYTATVTDGMDSSNPVSDWFSVALTPPAPSPILTGAVTDASGNAISGAALVVFVDEPADTSGLPFIGGTSSTPSGGTYAVNADPSMPAIQSEMAMRGGAVNFLVIVSTGTVTTSFEIVRSLDPVTGQWVDPTASTASVAQNAVIDPANDPAAAMDTTMYSANVNGPNGQTQCYPSPTGSAWVSWNTIGVAHAADYSRDTVTVGKGVETSQGFEVHGVSTAWGAGKGEFAVAHSSGETAGASTGSLTQTSPSERWVKMETNMQRFHYSCADPNSDFTRAEPVSWHGGLETTGDPGTALCGTLPPGQTTTYGTSGISKTTGSSYTQSFSLTAAPSQSMLGISLNESTTYWNSMKEAWVASHGRHTLCWPSGYTQFTAAPVINGATG